MGVYGGPEIKEDGLVLALDAGNPKNYNAGISTNWTDKVGGNNGTLVGGTYHTDGPFVGAGYVEFDGSTEYLSIADSADLRLGTGTFTIEAWIYPHTVSPTYNSSIVVKGSSSAATTWQFDISNTSKLRFQYDASSSFSSSSSLVANVWTHVAVVREGTGTNETKLYINGVLDTTGTVASDFSTTDTMKIGRNRGGGTVTYYNGYISNLRVVKGTALYTSNFTPPTRTLTAVPNTVLLTCQGNTIADASSSNNTITVNGDASANLGFPASAFEFDGTNDYVILSDFDKAAYGTTNFSLSLWFNADSGTYKSILQVASTLNSTTPWIGILSYSGFGLRVYVDGNYRLYQPYTQGVWNNFVITFDSTGSGSWTFYLNGSSVGSYTGPIGTNGASATYLGNGFGANYFDGKISNFTVHQKTLSSTEVTQNYIALRGRYGI